MARLISSIVSQRLLFCRTFATEAPDTLAKLRLSFVTPYQIILKDSLIDQVNLSTTDGDVGILANHVPSIMQLKPGLIEIIKPGQEKLHYFASGGFAMINPDSTMEISALEVVPVAHLDNQIVAEGLIETQKRVAKDDSEKAEIEIHQQVYSALNYALQKSSDGN